MEQRKYTITAQHKSNHYLYCDCIHYCSAQSAMLIWVCYWNKIDSSILTPLIFEARNWNITKNGLLHHFWSSNFQLFTKIRWVGPNQHNLSTTNQVPEGEKPYFLKSKTPSVIRFSSRWQGQELNLQIILNDFLDGQDPFTKSGGNVRSLRPEVWNFAWDLVWPIHMPYNKPKNWAKMRQKIRTFQLKLD